VIRSAILRDHCVYWEHSESEGANARGGNRSDSRGEDTCHFYCQDEE
jgi:hypothetical protein